MSDYIEILRWELKELHRKKDQFIIEKAELKAELTKITEEGNVAIFLLGFGNYIRCVEEMYCPQWLMEKEMQHFERWMIILQQDDEDILIFLARMKEYELSPIRFCQIMDKFYNTIKSPFDEYDFVPDINNETTWQQIFSKLHLYNKDSQNSMKVIAKKITMTDKVFSNIKEPCGLKEALLYLRGFPCEFTEEDIKKFVKIDDCANGIKYVFLFKDKSKDNKFNGKSLLIVESINVAGKLFKKMYGHRFKNTRLHIEIHNWLN